MIVRVISITLIFCLLSLVSVVLAEVIGTNGATYPIKEPDAYEEILSKVKNLNWQSLVSKAKKNINQKTQANFSLKHAKEDRVFQVDPTYTLEFDITDEYGRIIYPKGFQFNPLDYMQYPYRLVFFDATSVTEITWLKKQDFLNRWDTMLIATKGDVLKAQKLLGKTVYIALPKMIERWGIEATPSILYTKGRVIEIYEVGIYGKK